MSHRMPKFEQSGKFTGESQSASRWLRRIKIDLASGNSGTVPTSMYLWAIDALLEGPAARWCDSVPTIKHILENYDAATLSEVKWLECELVKRFPGNDIDSPVDRVITRSRSYSLDVSADSDIAAIRLGELYLDEKSKSWNQKSRIPQAAEMHRKHPYHDGRGHRREIVVDGNVVDEYQFYSRRPSNTTSHYDNYHSFTTINKTLPISKKHSSERVQTSMIPRSILKNSTSQQRQSSVHYHDSQGPSKDRHSRARSHSPFQSNYNSQYYQKFEATQLGKSPQPRHLNFESHPSAPRPMFRSSRTPYREVVVIPSKPQEKHWSYVPLTTTRSPRHSTRESIHHEDDILRYQNLSESSSGAWKTSNSAIATLEQRHRALILSSRKPVMQDEARYERNSIYYDTPR